MLASRMHEPLGARADGAFVLLADRFWRAAPLGDVAPEAALEANIGIGLHVDLRIEHAAQLGPVKDEQALHDQKLARLDSPRLGGSRVIGERVDGLLEGAPLRDRLKVLMEEFPIERV